LPPRAATEPDPFAGLPAHHNLRDLGGPRGAEGGAVRRGLLFRGASLHRLGPEQIEQLAPLGLRTAIDLRTSEQSAAGTYPGPDTRAHGLPIFERGPEFPERIEDPAATLTETYLWMLEQGRATIPRIFALLADPESYPAVVFCAAGKDRTGIVCALVLDQLGVGRAEIAADYALSDAPAEALRLRVAEVRGEEPDPVPAGIYRAPARAITDFFDALDQRFGSPAGYLEEIGVPLAEVRRSLRATLLEPGDGRPA
jgi:protein-tyrosine phosphatase